MKETDFITSLKNFLESCGAYVIRIKPVRMRCPKCGQYAVRSCIEAGVPDIVVCLKGKFVGLEGKMPGRNMSHEQEIHKLLIEAAGGKHLVVKQWKRRNVYKEISEALGLNVLV